MEKKEEKGEIGRGKERQKRKNEDEEENEEVIKDCDVSSHEATEF